MPLSIERSSSPLLPFFELDAVFFLPLSSLDLSVVVAAGLSAGAVVVVVVVVVAAAGGGEAAGGGVVAAGAAPQLRVAALGGRSSA